MKSKNYYQVKIEQLVQEIEKQQLKRWWLAEMAGIHKTTLRRWIQGKTRYIQQKKLHQVARVLSVPVGSIAFLSGDEEKKSIKTNS